ncbi:ATP-binding protein [Streptomyces prasinopilosus]|uniref:ATP-binding protein n=1 Tax=Streptomyces prasinopilosus TaxID=67344 RepID=UPI00099F07AB
MNQETVAPRTPLHRFTVPLSATRRGARLARLLAAEHLDAWGLPLDPARLIVAELAANAVVHGRVPGRGFSLLLALDDTRGVIRVEVSDTHPALPVPTAAAADEEHGRGLALVDALAARWGVTGRTGPGKTVWAECATVTDGPRPTRTPPGREAVSAPPEGRPRPTPAHGLVSVPDTDV